MHAFWLCVCFFPNSFFFHCFNYGLLLLSLFLLRFAIATQLELLFSSLVLSLSFAAPLPISCFVSHLLSATGVPRFFLSLLLLFIVLFCFVFCCVVLFFLFISNEIDNEFSAWSAKGSVKFHAKQIHISVLCLGDCCIVMGSDRVESKRIEKKEQRESRIRFFFHFAQCSVL